VLPIQYELGKLASRALIRYTIDVRLWKYVSQQIYILLTSLPRV